MHKSRFDHSTSPHYTTLRMRNTPQIRINSIALFPEVWTVASQQLRPKDVIEDVTERWICKRHGDT